MQNISYPHPHLVVIFAPRTTTSAPMDRKKGSELYYVQRAPTPSPSATKVSGAPADLRAKKHLPLRRRYQV